MIFGRKKEVEDTTTTIQKISCHHKKWVVEQRKWHRLKWHRQKKKKWHRRKKTKWHEVARKWHEVPLLRSWEERSGGVLTVAAMQ